MNPDRIRIRVALASGAHREALGIERELSPGQLVSIDPPPGGVAGLEGLQGVTIHRVDDGTAARLDDGLRLERLTRVVADAVRLDSRLEALEGAIGDVDDLTQAQPRIDDLSRRLRAVEGLPDRQTRFEEDLEALEERAAKRILRLEDALTALQETAAALNDVLVSHSVALEALESPEKSEEAGGSLGFTGPTDLGADPLEGLVRPESDAHPDDLEADRTIEIIRGGPSIDPPPPDLMAPDAEAAIFAKLSGEGIEPVRVRELLDKVRTGRLSHPLEVDLAETLAVLRRAGLITWLPPANPGAGRRSVEHPAESGRYMLTDLGAELLP